MLLGIAILLGTGCNEDTPDPEPDENIPAVATATITEIDLYTAMCGGEVTAEGSSPVTARGICWSTNPVPVITDDTTMNGTGQGSFTSQLSGLGLHETYFVRAYATNAAGTGYGDVLAFISGTTEDLDGNLYHFIEIGTQVWMVENLKTTTYNDGTSIQNVTALNWSSETTPAYCWYDNDDIANKETYGALYNWHAVNTGKLAPAGWHVATDADWTTLTTHLGGSGVAGGKLKESGTMHWNSPNTGATDEAGFRALPGGLRGSSDAFIGSRGRWWTSTAASSGYAWPREMKYDDDNIGRIQSAQEFGFSVRCVRD